MMTTMNKIKCGLALFGVVLVLYAIIVAPVAAGSKAPNGGPDDTKIDVGIYSGINGQGNPTDGDPKDVTVFHFKVYWTVTQTRPSGTTVIVDKFLGVFNSAQGSTESFPQTYGKPYKISWTECVYIPFTTICMPGTTVTIEENGFYHISHYDVPYGYCPQFPDGQDRKKDGTTTENMKFYKGSVCGDLYPGWNGFWGTCTPTWRRCYIRIV